MKKEKKEKKRAEVGNFSGEMLELINQVRANPASFSQKILDAIPLIRKDEKTGKLIFETNGVKVSLARGEDAFRAAAEVLQKIKPGLPLQMKEELNIPVLENPDDWNNNEKMIQLLKEKKKVLDDQDLTFNMDKGNTDPASSLLCQIIDDSAFKGKRRDNIFNPEHRYIAISFLQSGKKFCCYLTFSK